MERELLEELETWRCRMYTVAADKDLSDPEVLMISQRIDVLVNRLYALERDIDAHAA
ncbi:Aspartyl-phosphate phosphatase Spo0E-like [Acididesulfobacillus acetoxydans]|uniref:Aspartyl-phosphate phosphatase Spo0E-like n=1 Tax=Acididesulfobacillus acetoxydans TaxID=1561005 RepID=A0A8S0W1R7_9FIRM|nr:aspartyl-phosphate phosphatase Spo0E family protein [Acididesulfobacillus acetoxydans]CAA7599778.1 Aspartyl-phosphate phosphatase Spo0E-like [Acididesulfobacillus acetoxydans]CEJ07344.1 Spo0E like sporulation regulatory protein [Acididesulfobacillus acetoxydans]